MAAKNFLAEIIEKKKRRLEILRAKCGPEELRVKALAVRGNSRPHSFYESLNAHSPETKIIAEFKRASPSKGTIRADLSPQDTARAYAAGGASAISILTEEDYFEGTLDDLSAVRAAVALPLLRKDFIFDEYQVYEAAAACADAVLLIAAALDDESIVRLRRLAEETFGMDVLLEVHTRGEMERAAALGAKIVGVNNRDLHTFEVSLDVSVQLARYAPATSLLVSESGLHTREDLRLLQGHGYRAFLVGETLMRSPQPEEALRELARVS